MAQDDDTRVQVVGQANDAPMNALGVQFHSNLSLSPTTSFVPGVTVTYERAFSDMMSLAIDPGLMFSGGVVSFGLDLELRFHLMGESLNGLYVAPTAGFWLTSAATLLPMVDFGAVVGYSYLINNMIQIGVGVGFTYSLTFASGGTLGVPSIPIRAGVAFAF